MRGKWALILAGAGLLADIHTQAAGSPVSVSPARESVLETNPRQVVTAAFRVTNSSEEMKDLLVRVDLPSGWNRLSEEAPFQLGPGESTVRLMSFFVPSEALPGTYELTYSLSNPETGTLLGASPLSVIVVPFTKLEAKLLRAPDYVVAGEEYQALFTVTNHGNAICATRVKLDSSDGFAANPDPAMLELGPGQSREVAATVKTDPGFRQEGTHRLELRLIPPEGDEGKPLASAKSSVEIVPQVAGTDDPFHRLPVKFAVRSITESGLARDQKFQANFMGSGTLDDEGKKRIDFLFRGPDAHDWSTLAERDEYRLSYQTDKYQVHLGDHIYSLSPLTEWYRYGCGIDVGFNFDRFSLGGYRQESRWFEPKEEQVGARLGYQIADNYSIGLNCLKKKTLTHRFDQGVTARL